MQIQFAAMTFWSPCSYPCPSVSIREQIKRGWPVENLTLHHLARNSPAVLYSIVPLSILGVIPARYASSRFPGKALVSIGGKTMLQHVWERASQARYLTSVVIATDDTRIRAAAEKFHARVVMTRYDHPSGTDRVAE